MNDTNYVDALFAQQACIWEATARKPGNVHRYRDFDDLSYLDFILAAAAIAPCLAVAREVGLGGTLFNCACMTRSTVATNPNLGILLLLTPLAMAQDRDELRQVLAKTTIEDAKYAYQAIRILQPGGLGQVAEQDVHQTPTVPLREAMQLAAARDLIARQYVNDFDEVFTVVVPLLLAGLKRTQCWEGAILDAQLHLMSRFPDTLIARKCGSAIAQESAERAQRVLEQGWPTTPAGRAEIQALDDWLRADGHRRNPGTTADLLAAGLYVLRRSGQPAQASKIPWELLEGAPR